MEMMRATGGIPADPEPWVQVGSRKFSIIKSLLRSQGLTNDGHGNFWFSGNLTLLRTRSPWGSADKIAMLPFSKVQRKLGVNHIGDIDYADGKIFAPLEDGSAYQHPVIGIFDADTLRMDAFAELPRNQQEDGVPWVAVDAKQGRCYSSQYHAATSINVYSMSTLKPLGRITMSHQLDSIQGAKVLNGDLYMTANAMQGDEIIKDRFTVYKMDLGAGAVTRVAEFQDKLYEVEGMTFVPNGAGFDLYVLGQIGKGLKRRMAICVFRLSS